MARTETVTVVFTDLVGSTELASRLGHDAYEELRREHFAALRAAVAAHGGVVVKSTGDGLMLRFDSAASAVACAVAMQQAADAAARRAGRHPIQIRVGVSSGEATQDNEDLYGPPVVEAARLCAAAAAGQILVSDVVRLLARGKGYSFTSVGELALKGLPDPVPASEVGWAPLAARVPLPPRLATMPALSMVGRSAEQAVLAEAWRKAKDGKRQVVLLAGEPGIGKTRLATETALAAHAEGATVLFGTCDEDVNLPYRPFVEALRHYVAHAPEEVLAAHVREHKGELARLTPDLARRVPELPAPQVAEAATERYLLFEAVTGLLSLASEQQPILLILDDLQWAGTSELLLLRHILHTSMPLRLLIIGTYRDTDLTRAHPLTAVLADLRRESGVERVGLGGLDEAAVVELITAAAGHALEEPGLALARAIHRETEGSPLFIGEILRNLTESGAVFREGARWTYRGDIAALGIPEGVKEAIGRRLARLSEDANKVLGLAAVIGRQFDLALLVRIAELPEEAILDALEAASAAALVAEVPGSPELFSFSHALIRATLYDELSAARRARLHRRVGEALEDLTGGAPGERIDELAYHWLSATKVADADKAIRYACQAGDGALANLAFEKAAAHYERALAVLEPRDRAGETLRCDLLIARADAERRAGNMQYRDTVRQAVEAARALGDGERFARAVLTNARPGGYTANHDVIDTELIALYEEAIAALGGVDSLLRARLLGQLAMELLYADEHERRDRLTREAVAIARRVGDRAGLAQILALRIAATHNPFTLAERLELVAELSALAEEVGSRELAWHAAFHRACAGLASSDVAGFEQSLAELERLAAELRQPFYGWCTRVLMALLPILRGAPDAEQRALAALESATERGQLDAVGPFGAQLFQIRHHQGRLAELTDVVRANIEAFPQLVGWRAWLGLLFTETDRFDEAREQLAILARSGYHHPLNWLWPSFLTSMALLVAALRDRDAAAALYERVCPLAGQVSLTAGLLSGGSYALYCGTLAACLERWEEADRHFAQALAMNERIGARPYVVFTRRYWTEMLLDRNAPGDRERAAELIAAGRAEAEQLGMARELVCLERLQARLAA